MAFKYRKPSEASVKAQSEQSGGSFASIFKDGLNEFKPKMGGEYTIRIAPASWGDDDNPPDSYAHEVYVNYGIGPDEEGFISRAKMGFKDDPVREMHDRLRRKGDEHAEQLKRQATKKRRPMYIRQRGENDIGWQPWSCPWTVQRDISKAAVSKRRKTVKFIDDPDNGYDVTFSRESSGYGSYHIEEIDPEPSPIDEDPKKQKELLDWLEEHPLPEQYQIYSYEEIKRRCDGDEASVDEDEDEDEDDLPRTRSAMRRATTPGPQAHQDDVDDVDDDGDDEEEPPALIDDEEEELDEPAPIAPPAPKRRKPTAGKGVKTKARAKG